MDIQVAILAGGLATRLGELTRNRPKSLVEILHKPFLTYQLELLKQQGVTDVVLCIGHLGGQIKEAFGDGGKYGLHIHYSIEDRPLGTAGALKNAELSVTRCLCGNVWRLIFIHGFTENIALFSGAE